MDFEAHKEELTLEIIQKYRMKHDNHVTKTFSDQKECEESCGMFFFPLSELPIDQQLQLQELHFINTEHEPCLMRDKHVEYLKRGLAHLSGGFVALDASRPWICYWILHALELLQVNMEEYYPRTISTIKHFWHPEGGFGGGPMQLGHTATTYASCLTLALIGTPEALDIVDRNGLYRFFLRRKHHASGAFSAHEGGEVDVRVTYCVICIASLYGILTPELTKGVIEYVASCQTYEGGFGGEPGNEAHGGYAFCAIATLFILNSIDQINLETLIHWLTNRQMAFEGGYQGRTNKLVDGCYSFWQGAIPALVADTLRKRDDQKQLYQCNQIALQKYILLCGQQIEGGLRDKPGKTRDHYHTCYCLSGLSIAQHGDGLSDPVVYGDKRNLLHATHPAYNIGKDKVEQVTTYFQAKGFQPDTSYMT